MPIETARLRSVMEAKGAYNKHSRIPAEGAALATPFLEKAVSKTALGSEDQPVVIADYGSSQGKNSIAAMQIAIRNLRLRIRPNRSIVVFHIDQPSNDFNTLFEVLNADPDRYSRDEPNVFPCAIGRSFYEQVLPPDSVHLGWCSYAVVWLSRIPALIPGHFFPLRSTGAVRDAFDQQSAEDWKSFLSLRACEMRPGSRLVVVLPVLPDSGLSGFANMMDLANEVVTEMVNEGAISAEERARMVVGAHPRRKDQLLAPFANGGEFKSLTVEDCEILVLPDAAWADYERDGDKESLASKQALFFRSVFMPALASALTRVRAGDSEAQRAFADRLQSGLTHRLASRPTRTDMFVETIVLAKRL